MAIREIVKVPDEVLGKTSRQVEKFDARLHSLLDDMHDTLDFVDGMGLASVQIGILRRVFIVKYEDETIECINPEFIEKTGNTVNSEGCLSIPGQYMEVNRAVRVVIRAQDRFGKEFTREAVGMLAYALQHEYDHLDGIVIQDKALSPQRSEK